MRRFPKLSFGKQCISGLNGIRLAMILAMALAVCYHAYLFYINVTGVRSTESAIALQTKKVDGLTAELASSTGLSASVMPVEHPLEGGKFMSTFIRQITDLAGQAGCKLNTIKPKPIEVITDPNAPVGDAIKYKPIEVTIEMLADYRGVNDFIAGLSKLPKVMKVTQIELSRRSVDPRTHRALLDAKLTLTLCMIDPGKTI